MSYSISKRRLWTARIMSGLVVLFMLVDSISKLFKPAAIVKETVKLGYSEHHIVTIGVLGLISTLLYAYRRTSILGALLLTGYYGGVVATHIRLDQPLFSYTLFPVYLSILVWGGLWLKSEEVRNLIPLQGKKVKNKENQG